MAPAIWPKARRTHSYGPPSTGNVVPTSDVRRPEGIQKVAAETTSQKIAWEPYEEDCPMVSMARMAQTVKKIRSNRKSDFLSLRFYCMESSLAAIAANAYPSFACLALGRSLSANVDLG